MSAAKINPVPTLFNDTGGPGGQGAGDGVLSTTEEIANFNTLLMDDNAFYKADADGNGSLSLEEFNDFYNALSDSEFVNLFDSLDVNGDGVLSVDDGLSANQIAALEGPGGDGAVKIGEASVNELRGFNAVAAHEGTGVNRAPFTNDAQTGWVELARTSGMSAADAKFTQSIVGDGNGFMTAEEIGQAQKDGLITIDESGKISLTDNARAVQRGEVSLEDVKSWQGGNSWQGGVNATDTNGDGKLSADELGVSQEIVDLIDADGDDLLSAYELAAASGGGVDQAQSLFTDLNYFTQSDTNGDGVLNSDDTSAWGAGAESYHAEWDSEARGGNGDGVMNFAEYRNYYQENPSG